MILASFFGQPFISGDQKRFILFIFLRIQKIITLTKTKKASSSKEAIKILYSVPKPEKIR
jgi:hypothetical protein